MDDDQASRSADIERAVREAYSAAARAPAGLCCPTTSDPKLLAAIPAEVLERDYGCGDPSVHVRPGETVLDLGAGAGKAVFLASQIVGPTGRALGVDMNDEMVALARRATPEFVRRVGYDNVRFLKGRIQDLALDLERLDRELSARPVRGSGDLARLEATMAQLRAAAPLIADGSVDVVVSDCVLNLVRPDDKQRLFREIHRVLRRGGRAVISDIVSDEDVPARLQADPALWTGCISGALREDRFLAAFADAGLYGVTVAARQEAPWRVVEGVEFRSVTVLAWKGKEGACMDHKQAVIYRGPFSEVRDDDGHVLRRGERMAVCRKTFDLYARAPYREHVVLVAPRVPVAEADARPFPCGVEGLVRDPRETKGEGYAATTEARAACAPGSGCCG